MNTNSFLVTKLPLQVICDDSGLVSQVRGRWLNQVKIREYLRKSAIRFIVADIGKEIRWVPLPDCYLFWKTEQAHIASPESNVSTNDYDGGYFYFASEWMNAKYKEPLILLERHH